MKAKSEAKDKAEIDWAEGLWLGHARASNEVLIGTKNGVVRAWAVRRRDPEDRWDADLIKNMQGTPQKPNPNKPGAMIPVRITFDKADKTEVPIIIQPAREEEGPRSMYIKAWMLEKYGYTEGCKGCDHKRAGQDAQRPHNQVCRSRMEVAVEQDARGRAAKARTDHRFQQWEQMEREKDEKNDKVDKDKKDENDEKDEKDEEDAEDKTDENDENEEKDEKDEKGEEEMPAEHHYWRGGIHGAEDEPVPEDDILLEEEEKRPIRMELPKARPEKRFRSGGQEEIDKKPRIPESAGVKRAGDSDSGSRQKRKVPEHVGIKRGSLEAELNEVEAPKKVRDESYELFLKEVRDEALEATLLVLHPGYSRRTQDHGDADNKDAAKKTRKLLKVRATDFIRNVEGKEILKDEDHEVNGFAWDDMTGVELDAREVKKARKLEIEYARRKKVWIKITRAEAKRRGWKIIKTRWIDINKGDSNHPIHRSRFVAKEFNDCESEGLFAGTPPLEALRLILSRAATRRQERLQYSTIMINDVSRAFFEAPIGRNVCIELPEEDLEEGDHQQDLVGLLRQSLYGTRDAAANFQKEVKKFMTRIGFKVGHYNPCTYRHAHRDLRTFVHGDDFVTEGRREDCDWFKKKLEGRFEIKTKMVGLRADEVREERILNRVIRVTGKGWEMEADQRHADIIIHRMNLKGANGVKTPCDDEKSWEIEVNENELDYKEGKLYRELAARANYLAQDRPDIQFSVKELCRGMCRPTKGDVKKLRRLARYLISTPRMITKYDWQEEQGTMRGWSDSDFAGCRRTAKSTSGGILTIGVHYIKSWASTQKTIALSSGEAELSALVKCSCELLGALQLARDWDIDFDGEVHVDSSAALGVVGRRGAGKLRHVRVGQLWVQQKSEDGELRYRKVKGTENPADAMTKALTQAEMDKYMRMVSQQAEGGRAAKGLHIAGNEVLQVVSDRRRSSTQEE